MSKIPAGRRRYVWDPDAKELKEVRETDGAAFIPIDPPRKSEFTTFVNKYFSPFSPDIEDAMSQISGIPPTFIDCGCCRGSGRVEKYRKCPVCKGRGVIVEEASIF